MRYTTNSNHDGQGGRHGTGQRSGLRNGWHAQHQAAGTLLTDAFALLQWHPTSAEIYEAVHQQNPNVSRATVYRNLGVLSDRGEVLRIPVPNAADYDFRCDNHFHAKCERCGGVFDIETEAYPFARITKDYGFQATGFDLAFSAFVPSTNG